MKKSIQRLAVYCASQTGHRPIFRECAERLGRTLGERHIDLVYGGACRGLMGVAADAALEAGGQVIGVIPKALVEREIAHRGISKLFEVHSMHERKAKMTELADAFLILPGAYGTLDEMCEALTWAQLGIHNKPCGLWNIEGYYDSFLAFLERAVREGFLKAEYQSLLLVDHDLDPLLEQLEASASCASETHRLSIAES